jgi:hypothetical protein
MFSEPRYVFDGAEGVGSRFHILHSRACLRRYGGCRVSISCFALLDSFSAVPRASGPVFVLCVSELIFGGIEGVGSHFHVCAPGLIFDGTEGVGSHFHVLCSRTRFRWCRVRRLPFSCFARPDSFSAVLRASDPVFMFSALGHVFGGAEGVVSRFQFLRSWTHFRQYRGRRVPFSCFALLYTFSAVPRSTCTIFIICTP